MATGPQSVDRPLPIPSILWKGELDELHFIQDRLDKIEPSGRLSPSTPIRALVTAPKLAQGIEDGKTGSRDYQRYP